MKLFCYGTLKRGHAAHNRLMKGAKFLGSATIEGALYGHGTVGYPMVKLNHDHHLNNGPHVRGELFEITDDLLPNLDRYEGHPHHYERKLYPVTQCSLDDENSVVTVDAYVYEYKGDVSKLSVIESGVF